MSGRLNPIIFSIEVMDKNRLLETRALYRPLARIAWWHFLRRWLRSRFAAVTVIAYAFFLFACAFQSWIGITGKEEGISGWAIVGAIAIGWSLKSLFESHAPMHACFERWRVQEQEDKETLDMNSQALHAIRCRLRTLARHEKAAAQGNADAQRYLAQLAEFHLRKETKQEEVI